MLTFMKAPVGGLHAQYIARLKLDFAGLRIDLPRGVDGVGRPPRLLSGETESPNPVEYEEPRRSPDNAKHQLAAGAFVVDMNRSQCRVVDW